MTFSWISREKLRAIVKPNCSWIVKLINISGYFISGCLIFISIKTQILSFNKLTHDFFSLNAFEKKQFIQTFNIYNVFFGEQFKYTSCLHSTSY